MAKERCNVGGKGSFERMPGGGVVSHDRNVEDESLCICKQPRARSYQHTYHYLSMNWYNS